MIQIKRRRFPLLLPSLVLFFVLSCAGGPKPPSPENPAAYFDLLAPGASAYCYTDVIAARPLLELLSIEGMNSRDMEQVLNRTTWAAAAFYPPGSLRRFHAAGWGRYPGKGILTLSSGWKKEKSPTGGAYWRSRAYGLSVSLSPRLALISDADPLIQSTENPLPEGFGDFVRDWPLGAELPRNAVIAGWMEGAADSLNRFFESLEIPLQIPADRLLFAVYPAGPETYETLLRLQTPSATQARALTGLFVLTRLFIGGARSGDPFAALEPLFANLPLQDDADLILRTPEMDAAQIALLFNLFSVYSKRPSGVWEVF